VRYEEPEAQEVPIIYGTYSYVRIGSCQNFGSILFCSRCQNMAPSEANFKVELRRTNEEKREESGKSQWKVRKDGSQNPKLAILQ
jgi:hypothetical protein